MFKTAQDAVTRQVELEKEKTDPLKNTSTERAKLLYKPPLNHKQRPMTGNTQIKSRKLGTSQSQMQLTSHMKTKSNLDKINFLKTSKISELFEGNDQL